MFHEKVLVTGAGGFIGSHLCQALVRRGATVRAMTQYNSRHGLGWLDSLPRETLDSMETVRGDIRDAAFVRRALGGCGAVFHLAALISIPYSYQAPESYVDTNVKGTLNVLQAALDLGTPKVVQTSTSEVYGTARFVPITEEHPLRAQSPYAASKIGADQLALSFHDAFGLPVTVVRPFNTYGPRQPARAVIPTIISQIASGMRTIRLGSLHPTRDFCFVTDTAEGFLAVSQAPEAVGEVVNLGTGFEVSIGRTAECIAEVMGVEVTVEQDPQRVRPSRSEVERLCADNSKCARLTGWRPHYSGPEGLRRGLAETARWFLDPANLAAYRPDVYSI